MARDYNAAVAALNTLQSNFSIVDAIRKSGRGMNKEAIPEMIEWCRRIGYQPSDFNRLNIIHIAGTKGKGSTAAFISSILNQYLVSSGNASQKPLHNVGLYTSPHLRFVRERIQINNAPISEDMFARYFFEVWDRLEKSAEEMDLPPSSKPVYFRYLTLMAFHAYLCEGVDTAIFECGIGGEYDSTNIIERPTVAAITSLDIDHTAMLGSTVEEIAWHKAGVFKRESYAGEAYTVTPQPGGAMDVLRQRAEDVGAKLSVVGRHPQIESGQIQLGLAADFQKINASLAVAVAASHLKVLGHTDLDTSETLPIQFRKGLEQVKWGGRCEIRREANISWHIDGGHTLESIRLGAEWFASCIKTSPGPSSENEPPSKAPKRILIFNQQTRDAQALAKALHKTLSSAVSEQAPNSVQQSLFTHAIFCTNVTFTSQAADSEGDGGKGGRYKPDLVSINTSAADVSALTVQLDLAKTWRELDSQAEVRVEGTIEEAVNIVRDLAGADRASGDTVVFVTGSLHLVGGVLEVLETTGATSST